MKYSTSSLDQMESGGVPTEWIYSSVRFLNGAWSSSAICQAVLASTQTAFCLMSFLRASVLKEH